MRKIGLVVLAITTLVACVSDNEYDLFHTDPFPDSATTGFIGYYPFAAKLTDSLGIQNPFEFKGSLEYVWGVYGDSAGAIFLDGQKDYLRNFLEAGDSLALSFWMLPYPSYYSVVLFDYGVGELEVGMDAVSGATMPSYQLYVKQGETKQVSQRVIDCFMWHHIFVEAGSPDQLPRWYINGWQVEDTLIPMPFVPRSEIMFVGRTADPDTTFNKYYRGILDELRIFNEYLPDSIIEELYWLNPGIK